MNKLKPFAALAALAISAASANAAPIYATSVVDFTPGSFKRHEAGRADPASALGAADGKFVSLGFGGSLTLAFAQPFRAVGHVFEVTWNDPAKQIESCRHLRICKFDLHADRVGQELPEHQLRCVGRLFPDQDRRHHFRIEKFVLRRV